MSSLIHQGTSTTPTSSSATTCRTTTARSRSSSSIWTAGRWKGPTSLASPPSPTSPAKSSGASPTSTAARPPRHQALQPPHQLQEERQNRRLRRQPHPLPDHGPLQLLRRHHRLHEPRAVNTNLNHGQYDGYADDIWSLGVSILEFYLGRFPLVVGRQGDWASLMCAICISQPPEAPVAASPDFWHFITCCLQREPARRWTAQQLLGHPFITRNNGQILHQLLPLPRPLS
ncbi:hypothetical protein Tsubulata_008553 [Turnera subulata]|uniref:Protein kinase domain-containing protein n=1 Tax=Turnera subulata TaxID=218843 RepID=A0A9Q0F7Y5_9ROSI|nr:hypothetical protein Tsubulata_008553 [Turnera subulata]